MGKTTMSRRWRVRGAHSRGASAVEYALIVALVAAAVVLVSIALTRAASGAFSATAADVGIPPSDSVSGLVTASPPPYTPPAGTTSPPPTSATPTTTSATPTTTSATPTTSTPTPTPTPTQPPGTTAVAPGGSTVVIPVNPALATSFIYVSNPACTYVPALLPAGATLTPTASNTGQGNTLTTIGMVFAAPVNATHYQAITATCTFKDANSTLTATFSIWIS